MTDHAELIRTTVSVADGAIDLGTQSARFDPHHPESLLRTYLVLVRRARDRRRDPSLTLRRDDIDVLARHIGQTTEQVLGQLADLMGATRSQRTAMLSMLATGAVLIAATGSVAAGSPTSRASDTATTPSVATVVATTGDGGTLLSVTATAPSDGSEIDQAGVDQAAREATTSTDQDDPLPTGTADDGSTVAVGLPPVPPPELPQSTGGTGAEPPIGEPAVVLQSAPATVESMVLAAADDQPPTGIADDGSTVAVGLPPVPPLPGG
ncbi:MAG TPA: hypothetical protein VIS05_07595 [Ilumatobacter sp.]